MATTAQHEVVRTGAIPADAVAARAANVALARAVQTHGGNCATRDDGLTDLFRGVRTMRIAPVSEAMILNHVAQHTLGLPRSY